MIRCYQSDGICCPIVDAFFYGFLITSQVTCFTPWCKCFLEFRTRLIIPRGGGDVSIRPKHGLYKVHCCGLASCFDFSIFSTHVLVLATGLHLLPLRRSPCKDHMEPSVSGSGHYLVLPSYAIKKNFSLFFLFLLFLILVNSGMNKIYK